MQAGGEDRDRAAVGVVGRIDDELVVEGQGEPFGEADRLIGLDDPLQGIVEPAVADERPQSAGRNEIAVVGGEMRYAVGVARTGAFASSHGRPRCFMIWSIFCCSIK